MYRNGEQGSWKDAVTPHWMLLCWKKGEESTETKSLSQDSIFAWAVVLFGAEFSHLLWHMLALQLLQEKAKDHLSPPQSALRKLHCATKWNAHRYFFQCMCGSYLPRVDKLMPCCATGFRWHKQLQVMNEVQTLQIITFFVCSTEDINQLISGIVMIRAWNQSKTKGMPKTSANNPCQTEAGISPRLGKMNAVSYWLLAEHPQTDTTSGMSK